MTEENQMQQFEEKTKSEQSKKKRIEAKPLPVDKEKTREIEEEMRKEKEKLEQKIEEKKETPKKKEEKLKIKKEEAIARGTSYPVSKKHAMYICHYIKNKSIDNAISDLTQVINLKKAIPFKGEIPHRKGPMTAGRYPVKASRHFINLLKALRGNVIVNNLELEKVRIYMASASWASRPMRAGSRAAKRTNIILKAKEFSGGKK